VRFIKRLPVRSSIKEKLNEYEKKTPLKLLRH